MLVCRASNRAQLNDNHLQTMTNPSSTSGSPSAGSNLCLSMTSIPFKEQMVCHSARQSGLVKEVSGLNQVGVNGSVGYSPGDQQECQSILTTTLIDFPESV